MSHALTRLAILATIGAVGLSFGGCGGSDVTRARLERNLPQTFSNLYVQQAKLLGHKGITAQSLHAKAQCDKGGPKVADHGPGADWICQMTWNDPNIPAGTLPGKFEVDAHSNDCYTAGGPSKIVGLLTITDTHGNTVDNPVFEFDSCFNPRGSNAPTGVSIPTTSTTASPAASTLTLPASVPLVAHRAVSASLACSAGGGCGGTLTAKIGAQAMPPVTYAIASGASVDVPIRVPRSKVVSGTRVVLSAKAVIGTSNSRASTVRIVGP